MNLFDKIEQLERELEEAWNHNKFIQSVLDHAAKLGHDVASWVGEVENAVEVGAEEMINMIVDEGDGDDGCS